MAGRYYDQFGVGDQSRHELRRTVTETDKTRDSRSRLGAGLTVFEHRAQGSGR